MYRVSFWNNNIPFNLYINDLSMAFNYARQFNSWCIFNDELSYYPIAYEYRNE